jgi:hypothetical protein
MAVIMEDRTQDFSAIASLLWREREILETVLFKIVEEQLVLSSGQTRWLAPANRELQSALDQLRVTEVARAVQVDELCERLGRPAGATLVELAELAPAPWADILLDHREALRTLAAEIDAAAGENRRLLDAGSRAVREALFSLNRSVATYDASGRPANSGSSTGTSRIDEQA